MEDSPLSVTGSIVGIVALLISVSTIGQALLTYFSAYRDAPAELSRYTSSVSNTVDEKSFRLRANHVPGPLAVELGQLEHERYMHGRWNELLQEYFEAHLELEEELARIRREERGTGKVVSWTRALWVFKRKDLEESVRRVETLRMRKMATALNALIIDMTTVKDTLDRIEHRISMSDPVEVANARTVRRSNSMPSARSLRTAHSGHSEMSGPETRYISQQLARDLLEPPRGLRPYASSALGESAVDVVRTSFESRF